MSSLLDSGHILFFSCSHISLSLAFSFLCRLSYLLLPAVLQSPRQCVCAGALLVHHTTPSKRSTLAVQLPPMERQPVTTRSLLSCFCCRSGPRSHDLPCERVSFLDRRICNVTSPLTAQTTEEAQHVLRESHEPERGTQRVAIGWSPETTRKPRGTQRTRRIVSKATFG